MIKLFEWFETDDQIHLILEYLSGGELFDRLKAQKGDHFTEPVAASYVHKMLSAIAYCHRMNISHRDLKCVAEGRRVREAAGRRPFRRPKGVFVFGACKARRSCG